MSSDILELPPSVYKKLMDAARESGLTPAGWIAARLPQSPNGKHAPTAAEIAEANAHLRNHRIVCAQRTSSDNASIDADLARVYSDEPSK